MEESSWKTKKEGSSTLPSHLCRYFTIAEIRAATNNFEDMFMIGVGGFGNVYKGYIDEVTPVAIKRLKSDNEPLRWNKRLEILLGAARGLHYLHTGAKHNIIHRDVKSTNILLDEKWVAKVSDFGLSKVGPMEISNSHISTMVKGSIGYLDPECYLRHRLTLKSDVYSFGVVLLEVLCARPPLDHSLDAKNVSLVAMFKKCYDEGVIIEEMIDPFMKDSITSECLKCYCEMVLSCLHEDGNQRMSMSEVVGTLEFMLEMVMNEEDKKFDESDVCFTNSSDDYGSDTSKLSTISTSTKE
ncbi:hypothetical protein TSUD_168200 [Trifolium subterraneum]|nr:hypothetical protein TSUD_168200 [Trifolium subterraneum]